MICHKLLLLALFLVKYSHQTNETTFKPIDNRVSPLLNRVLENDSKSPFAHFLHELDSFLSESLLRQKQQEALGYIKALLKEYDNYNVSKGIQVQKVQRIDDNYLDSNEAQPSLVEDLLNYGKNHVIKVQLHDLVEDVKEKMKESTDMMDSSERSFGLKKLMLPFMIGVQIVKSVLFAMFLPSLLGSLGKVVGEGVKFLSSSQGYQAATPMGHNLEPMEDFEFKDPNEIQQYPDTHAEGSSSLYSYAYPSTFDYNRLQQPLSGTLPGHSQSSITNRYTSGSYKLNYIPNNNHHGSFYTKHNDKNGKHQDYKVFHNIPPSSLLLTNYDPFYSPLLSRMDSVFKQLGYETEACRERIICLMYKNPAKFAPYSNLISAQLSRELNELRKPSTDNPDILRFFKYMKAAKDGQDGVECSRAYSECYDTRESISPPMVKTFNEINKLVQARKLSK